MLSYMSRFEAPAYSILRFVTGFLFVWHGTQKLFGFPLAGHEAPAFVVYVGGGVELVGGLLVMLGLFTRPAAFVCSGQMAAAYWMAHGTNALLPIVNGGELAVLYCFAFLFISATGAGQWSLDARLVGGDSKD